MPFPPALTARNESRCESGQVGLLDLEDIVIVLSQNPLSPEPWNDAPGGPAGTHERRSGSLTARTRTAVTPDAGSGHTRRPSARRPRGAKMPSPDLMTAARLYHPGEPLQIDRIPRPECGPSDVLVRVEAVGICGSDIHIAIEGTTPTPHRPITLGFNRRRCRSAVSAISRRNCSGTHGTTTIRRRQTRLRQRWRRATLECQIRCIQSSGLLPRPPGRGLHSGPPRSVDDGPFSPAVLTKPGPALLDLLVDQEGASMSYGVVYTVPAPIEMYDAVHAEAMKVRRTGF